MELDSSIIKYIKLQIGELHPITPNTLKGLVKL